MAGLTKFLEKPRPWHTRSFYTARVALLCAGLLVFAASLPMPIFSGLSVALVFDMLALRAWHGGQMQLPSPLTDGTVAGRREKEVLKLCVAYGVFGFVAVSFGLLFAPGITEPPAFILRLFVIALLNVAGWHSMQWFREVAALLGQYNPPIVTATEAVTVNAAPQPI
ncbi:MAG: hypothetical protein H7Y38_04765, partial [Armatimonadetes bacterium]|nr:hypothetical protein [Armatimonadota bacterium]